MSSYISHWEGAYDRAAKLLKSLELDTPPCQDIPGEFLANKNIVPNPCWSCEFQDSCKITTDSFIEYGSGIPCLGDEKIHILNAPRDACFNCSLYDGCGDIIYARQRRDANDTFAATAIVTDAARVRSVAPPFTSEERRASSSTDPSEYRFPVTEPAFQAALDTMRKNSPERLLRFIQVASEKKVAIGVPLAYSKIRNAVCAASIALNEHGIYPPRLRQARKLSSKPKKSDRTPAEAVLLNDRQVIDLHWLQIAGSCSPERKWKDIFTPEGIHFERASAFASEPIPMSTKTEMLALSERQQLLLGQLQKEKTRERWRTIQDGSNRVRAAVLETSESAGGRLQPTTAAILPDAYISLMIARGSPKDAIDVLHRLTGKMLTSAQIGNCKRWLKQQDLMRTS